MKFFTNKSIVQKIIIAIILVVLFNFTVPTYSQAGLFADAASDLVIELMHLVTFLGDSVMNLLSFAMVGSEFGALNLEQDDPNLKEGSGSYVDPATSNGEKYETEEFKEDSLDGLIFAAWTVPNIIYCPENIFANKIAALDVNFINPNEYKAINDSDLAQQPAKSAAAQLRPTVATWYRSFRNIAIVGLLSVLVYLGIRILIGSTAQDKAKYKERLKDWVVALCLVFIIHFIMSGILIITENITSLFSSATEQNIIVSVDNGVKFKTNLTGYIRFEAQLDDLFASISYTILYIILVAYTAMFTFVYLKRVLYMAFFTMIAPLVALTYPIDKAGDGKAQAFNLWFKEYTMNAIIQPVHLLLFSMLVTSAMSLAISNPIYAVVAIGFLVPAEKFIKKMFGLDKASTPSAIGSFAAGAVASKGVSYLSNRVGGSSSGGNKNTGGNEQVDEGKVYKRPKLPDSASNTSAQEAQAASSNEPNQNDVDYYNQMRDAGYSQEELSQLAGDLELPGSVTGIQDVPNTPNTPYTSNLNPGSTGPTGVNDPRRRLTPEEQRQLEESNQSRGLSSRFKGVWDTQTGKIKDDIYANGGLAKTAVKGVASGAGKVARTGLKVGGGIVAATAVGAASIAASGDISTVASAIAAGASSGAMIGKAAGNKVGGAIENAPTKVPNVIKEKVYDSGWFTQQEKIEKEQREYDSDFMRSKDNIQFLRAQGVDSPQAYMQDGLTAEFLKNDITDINTIYNAKKLMREKNVSQTDAISAAKAAKDIPEGFKGNHSAQEAYIKGQIRNGMNEEKAKQMRDYIIAIQKNNRK